MKVGTQPVIVFGWLVAAIGLGCAPDARGTAESQTIGAASSAIASNCPTTALGIYNVCANASSGDGSNGNPWVGWETALNAVAGAPGGNTDSAGGQEIYFPAGYYKMTAQISLKPGWTVRGAGMSATWISSSYDGDAFFLYQTADQPGVVNVRVEDFTVQFETTSTSGMAAGIDNSGGTYFYIRHIQSTGFPYGVIFDQAEVSYVSESLLTGTVAGLWIANGHDHDPTRTAGYANVIGIRDSSFNLSSSSQIGIIDDGGSSHSVSGCNFSGGGPQIVSSGVDADTITDNYFENGTVALQTDDKTYYSHIGEGGDINLTFSHNFVSSCSLSAGGLTHVCVTLGSPYQVFMNNNTFASGGTAVMGVASVGEMDANANLNPGGSLFDGNPTWGAFSNAYGLGVNASNPTQALEVNGGMRLNTAITQPACAAATRGTFWVVNGASGVKDSVQICSKDALDMYAWRTLY